MASRTTIAVLALATATGLSSVDGLAMEPVSVDEFMIYVSFALDRRADSGRAGRVGLRFGEDVRDDIVLPHQDVYADESPTDHLDLRFHERDEGGVLVNGMSLQRKRDFDLFEQASPSQVSRAGASPSL